MCARAGTHARCNYSHAAAYCSRVAALTVDAVFVMRQKKPPHLPSPPPTTTVMSTSEGYNSLRVT